jgi:hypothetical protein
MPSSPLQRYLLDHRTGEQGQYGKISGHEPPKSGIPKRKKIGMHTPLSCRIDCLLGSNQSGRSITSEFFTADKKIPRSIHSFSSRFVWTCDGGAGSTFNNRALQRSTEDRFLTRYFVAREEFLTH